MYPNKYNRANYTMLGGLLALLFVLSVIMVLAITEPDWNKTKVAVDATPTWTPTPKVFPVASMTPTSQQTVRTKEPKGAFDPKGPPPPCIVDAWIDLGFATFYVGQRQSLPSVTKHCPARDSDFRIAHLDFFIAGHEVHFYSDSGGYFMWDFGPDITGWF